MKPMPSVTAFALKVAAIVGMTCNHIANVFGSELPEGAMGILSRGRLKGAGAVKEAHLL